MKFLKILKKKKKKKIQTIFHYVLYINIWTLQTYPVFGFKLFFVIFLAMLPGS